MVFSVNTVPRIPYSRVLPGWTFLGNVETFSVGFEALGDTLPIEPEVLQLIGVVGA